MLQNNKDQIACYHEHDSLLDHKEEEELSEEERKAAWAEYEAEKKVGKQKTQRHAWHALGYILFKTRKTDERHKGLNKSRCRRLLQPQVCT